MSKSNGAVLIASTLTFLALSASSAASLAFAQDLKYPQKPVRLIVPVTTGGGSDLLARVLGQQLAESLGQPFIIDNRAGAGGVIGSELAARAIPDGYTLIVAYPASHGINPAIRTTPAEVNRFTSAEIAKWTKFIRETGLKLE